MKKVIYLLLACIMVLSTFLVTACSNDDNQGETASAIKVKYYGQASEIVPLILSGKETIGLVPEPAVSGLMKKAQSQDKTLYKMDLQELYDSETKAYPQAVLMVKRSVIGAHQGLENQLQTKIDGGVVWAKQNPALAVETIREHGATTLQAPALSPTAIDGCKIYFQNAQSAKQSVKNYINGIIDIDSAKAKAVSDDFFYNGETSQNSSSSYTFIAPDGAPALAISKMMNDSDALSTGKPINYQILPALDVRNKLIDGGADFILCPVNMASQFYKENQADPYVMVAVVTHGNFYIVSTSQINFSDLAGKQIAVPMQGQVPDWTFQMVAKKHGLTCSTVE